MKNKSIATKLAVFAAALSPTAVFAQAVVPVDVSDVGTTIAGYIPAAMGAGLLVFAAVVGGKAIIKAFKAAMS